MADKEDTTYMIAHGASVTVVRDGKRVRVTAGAGFNFTADEIAAVTKSAPGSLRKPINEGTGKKAKVQETEDESEDDEDGDEDAGEAKTAKASGKKSSGKKKAAAKKADADDDEDI